MFIRPPSDQSAFISHMQEWGVVVARVFLFSLFPLPTCFINSSCTARENITYFSLLPPCFVSRCQLGIIGHRILLRTFVSEPCSSPLSLSCLSSFLSLKATSSKEDAQHTAQHKRQQAPLLILCVRAQISSPPYLPRPSSLSCCCSRSLSPSSLLPPTTPSPAF